MFLACDMPFVTAALLLSVHKRFGDGGKDLFVRSEATVGFPLVLRRDALPLVTKQIEQDKLSLHELARVLKARMMRAPPPWQLQLRNINTPEDWRHARRLWLRS
jgi:molybdopterin-guanine dinucleotide biosynthesis protein A